MLARILPPLSSVVRIWTNPLSYFRSPICGQPDTGSIYCLQLQRPHVFIEINLPNAICFEICSNQGFFVTVRSTGPFFPSEENTLFVMYYY